MTELRDAVATVIEELCEDSQSFEAADQQISASAEKLESVVQRLFECYIMERFKTFFCEHEAPKHGYEAADRILHEAREFISAEMDLQRADKHVRRELLPNQSPELLKTLHLLTRDGDLNADARRKLKQVNHLAGLLQNALTLPLSPLIPVGIPSVAR